MKTKQSTTEVLSNENDTSHSGYARLAVRCNSSNISSSSKSIFNRQRIFDSSRAKIFLGQYYDSFSGCVIKKWKEATPFGFVYFETIHYRY